MQIGRRIYYDKFTGEVLVDTGEREGDVIETTVEQDILTFKTLTERNIESFDSVQLEYGQHSQDFRECNGYRVNPETKELEFSYPDVGETEPQEPVYRKPLSEEVKELKARQNSAEDALLTLLASI